MRTKVAGREGVRSHWHAGNAIPLMHPLTIDLSFLDEDPAPSVHSTPAGVETDQPRASEDDAASAVNRTSAASAQRRSNPDSELTAGATNSSSEVAEPWDQRLA